MLRITSKQVVALKGTPLIYELPFNQLQDWLNGVHPDMPRKNHKYDSGKPRQTNFDAWLGLDSQNERAANPGAGSSLGRDPNESTDKRLSSGYNDGGRADDETGPGHKSDFNPKEENAAPYHAVDVNNEVFMQHRLNDSGRDSPTDHMRKIRTSTPVTMPHRRYKVDSQLN